MVGFGLSVPFLSFFIVAAIVVILVFFSAVSPSALDPWHLTQNPKMA